MFNTIVIIIYNKFILNIVLKFEHKKKIISIINNGNKSSIQYTFKINFRGIS